MPEYFFLLGRDEALAAAELQSYLSSRNVTHDIFVKGNISVVKAMNIDLEKAVKELGGTVKAGIIVAKLPLESNDPKNVLDKHPFWTGKDNKLNWTITILDDNKEMEKMLKDYFKQRFKDEGLKAMWKAEPRPWEQATWKAGIEIVGFYDGKNICVGKTLSVFNPREAQKRDLGRPVQKPEIAISLRLARMLINLSGARPGSVILDPFCGIGTILQEAMLLGIDAKGVDIEPNNIDASNKNLAWFCEKYSINNKWLVVVGDARELPETFERESVNAIATEPYLGPLLKSRPSDNEARKIVSELTPLYKDFLTAAYAVLSKGGRMAVVFPRFSEATELPLIRMAESAGFRLWRDDIFPYLYTSEKKKLDRLIFVLEKY